MPPEPKKWKKLPTTDGRGGNVYVGKEDLEKLARESDLDLDDDIEYSTSVGVSDGRARAFVQFRNPPEEADDGE